MLIKPEDTRVIAVGISNYDIDPAWKLPLAWEHALEFVRWALNAQVSPERVHLFLDSKTLRSITAPGGWNGITAPSGCDLRPATWDSFDRFLSNELHSLPGKLLYIYWSSHGAIAEKRRHILFHEDVTAHRTHANTNVEHLFERLRSAPHGNFKHQIAYIEACALYFERLNFDVGPGDFQAGTGDPRDTQQSFFFAADRGQTALNGEFSKRVLEQLQHHTQSNNGWPPNHDEVVKALKLHLPGDQQRPVHIRDLSGNEERLSGAGSKSSATPKFQRIVAAHPHGRSADIHAIEAKLEEHSSLVVLKGIGGIGKAALAQSAVKHLRVRFPEGARDIPLERLPRTDQVVLMILEWLFGKAEAQLSYDYQVSNCRTAFHESDVALVLENYEQLIKATKSKSQKVSEEANRLHEFFESLLGGKGVLIVTTQHVPTHLPGEGKPLQVDGVDLIAALKIYKDYAAQQGSDNEPVLKQLQQYPNAQTGIHEVPQELAHIPILSLLRKLDGHPLAIRLVAAAVAETGESPDQVSDRLEELLAKERTYGTTNTRHRSLNACFGYSLNTIQEEKARKLFARLSIFRGRFELDAIKAIFPTEDAQKYLSLLVKKDLVRESFEHGTTFYAMRPVLRSLARLQLRKLRITVDRKQLAQYHDQLLERLTHSQNAADLHRLKVALPDILQSFDQLRGNQKYRYGERLAGLSWRIGNTNHAKEMYETIALGWEKLKNRESQAYAIHELARIYHLWGDTGRAAQLFDEALTIRTAIGDRVGLAWSQHERARLARDIGNPEEALKRFEGAQAAFSELQKTENADGIKGTAWSLHEAAVLLHERGRLDQAQYTYEQCLQIWKKVPEERDGPGHTLNGIANLSRLREPPAEAFAKYYEAWDFWNKNDSVGGRAATLHNIAVLVTWLGELDAALRLCDQALMWHEQSGNLLGKAYSIHEKGNILRLQGKVADATNLYNQAFQIWTQTHNEYGAGVTLRGQGQALIFTKNCSEALDKFQLSLKKYNELNSPLGQAYTLQELGVLQMISSKEGAEDSFQKALKLWSIVNDQRGKAATLIAYNQLLRKQGELTRSRACLIDGLEIIAKIGGMTVSGTGVDQVRSLITDYERSDELQSYIAHAQEHSQIPKWVLDICSIR